MASELQLMAMDLCASLWHLPCTYDELFERKILKISEYNFRTIVRIAKVKNWIYYKGEVLYCYKDTVINVLNKNGYDVELNTKPEKSDFEKSFEKI